MVPDTSKGLGEQVVILKIAQKNSDAFIATMPAMVISRKGLLISFQLLQWQI